MFGDRIADLVRTFFATGLVAVIGVHVIPPARATRYRGLHVAFRNAVTITNDQRSTSFKILLRMIINRILNNCQYHVGYAKNA